MLYHAWLGRAIQLRVFSLFRCHSARVFSLARRFAPSRSRRAYAAISRDESRPDNAFSFAPTDNAATKFLFIFRIAGNRTGAVRSVNSPRKSNAGKRSICQHRGNTGHLIFPSSILFCYIYACFPARYFTVRAFITPLGASSRQP